MEVLVIADRRLPVLDAELIKIGGHMVNMMVIRNASPGPFRLTDTCTIQLPVRLQKAVIVVSEDGEYQIIPCPYKDASDSIRVFSCPNVGKFGIRTSLDWNETHWAREITCLKEVWIVAVGLPEGELHYKNVAIGLGGLFLWEPSSFVNKGLTLGPDAEFIEGFWSRPNVDRHVVIAKHEKLVRVTVTLKDTEVKNMLLDTGSDIRLVLNNLADSQGRKIRRSDTLAELHYEKETRVFATCLKLPRKLDTIRATINVLTQDGIITHVDGDNRQIITCAEIHADGDTAIPDKTNTSKVNLGAKRSELSVDKLIKTENKDVSDDEFKLAEVVCESKKHKGIVDSKSAGDFNQDSADFSVRKDIHSGLTSHGEESYRILKLQDDCLIITVKRLVDIRHGRHQVTRLESIISSASDLDSGDSGDGDVINHLGIELVCSKDTNFLTIQDFVNFDYYEQKSTGVGLCQRISEIFSGRRTLKNLIAKKAESLKKALTRSVKVSHKNVLKKTVPEESLKSKLMREISAKRSNTVYPCDLTPEQSVHKRVLSAKDIDRLFRTL